MKYTIHQVLLTLSYLNQGNWNKIYADVKRKRSLLEEEVKEAEKANKAGLLALTDSLFPEGLQHVNCPPSLLYYYGNLNLLSSKYRLTVVGSRTPTIYQNDTTYAFIKEVEEKLDHRVTIISGMAKGIDQAAMKAAMDTSSPIISVIGSGIDNPYPNDNDGIYDYCKSGKGLILSEYPGKTKAAPENFVFRNRLLAGLSLLVFVGGGKMKSGTMSTVHQALDLNDEILALPCNTTGDDLTNSLIRDGATSVLVSEDLVEAIKNRYDALS